MPVYTTRRDAEAYGYCVGILLLDYRGAFVPGDVGNATTYPVFDFITLIDFFQKGTHQKDYRGYN